MKHQLADNYDGFLALKRRDRQVGLSLDVKNQIRSDVRI